jgi:uncharacterized membrane protein YfcA
MTSGIILLCLVAFVAGFVDAIAGGGGLIQTPMGIVLLPHLPVSTVIGTLKIPAFSGTGIAAIQYAKKVKVNYRQLVVMMLIAFIAAFCGSRLLTMVHNDYMKPILLVVLTGVAVYTYSNKKFGAHAQKTHSERQQWLYAITISLVIGFYDGFIGPGAGSFLMISFISFLGYDFLKASANAKFVNLATNFGSICFFILSGKIIFKIALPMAVCNAIGGALGARLAIFKGNKFIRLFFLFIICLTIIRFAYDVFFK